jgi:hypothetical protein
MNSRIARLVLIALAFGLLATSCSIAAASDQTTTAAGPTAASGSQPALLEECDRPDIALGTAPTATTVTRTSAEAVSGAAGVRGPADIAVLTTVTVGTQTGQPATSTNALRDARGVPVVSRAAWVLVFRNQVVRTPGGIPPKGTAVVPPRPLSVLATVVDAQTGDFLRGWGCAFGN